MYLNNVVKHFTFTGYFLLELIRASHVRNLPVVVVPEVIAGPRPLVHQVVRPLPGSKISGQKLYYLVLSLNI